MKATDTEANFRIHYSMTLQEADLIVRMCGGYVGLEKELVKIKVVFPESEKEIRRLLSMLTDGVGQEIGRAKNALAVHNGTMVAVGRDDLDRLLAIAKKAADEAKASNVKDGE